MRLENKSPTAEYWTHLKEGKFALQKSVKSGKYIFYPRLICPETGSDELVFEEVDGRGIVYSTTTVRRSPKAGGDYNVALIDLDVGVRVPGRVVGTDPENVTIGMRVKAAVEKVDFGTYANSDQPVVVFYKE